MAREIEKGMWCVDEEGRVGIAYEDDTYSLDGKPVLNSQGAKVQSKTFHHVDEDGITILTQYRYWTGLKQAPFNSIPEARREGLSRDTAATLGYV